MSVLKIEQLKKSFFTPSGKKLPVIDVPAFSLDEGKFYGMHGGSGSGKTTFLHLIAGILRPDSGLIELQGKDVGKMSNSERDILRATQIGYVFQSFNLLQGFTCLENLEVAMSFSRNLNTNIAVELLERVGLQDRLSYYPHQLSIGQQQRVALARAMVNQPKLILADEPTGNLDAINAQKAVELVSELCEEKKITLLVVSHDSKIIDNFDRKLNWEQVNQSKDIEADL